MSGGLAFLGIAEAGELIRAKKLSPVEYTKVLLGQIERHDSKFNALHHSHARAGPDRGARGRG
jgi:Asp-tRNA(Asn)/Glu-tRNA(Gln) amidotransferase A subunit family amidase